MLISSNCPIISIDTIAGIVTVHQENVMGSALCNVTLSASGTAPGTYTTTTGVIMRGEMYDGTLLTLHNPTKIIANVLDSTQLSNKLNITFDDTTLYKAISDDFYMRAPRTISIYNDSPVTLTNQIIEYSIGSGYEVIEMVFPTSAGKPATIAWETKD
jgi:hypothetical protein